MPPFLMRPASFPVPAILVLTGSAYFLAVVLLAASRAPLGSPLFFTTALICALGYTAMLAGVWNLRTAHRRQLLAAFAFAVLFRAPLALAPVGADNDMIRYLWDGRMQRLGHNPYLVVPSDPALSPLHTPETSRMPSLRASTPYPPAAQLFFRLVVTIRDTPRAMKVALVVCDLLTIIVVWQWLAATGRNEWLALAYAWNPLVVLEVAHSGHMDALGALWIALAAYCLTVRRTELAVVAFVAAVATKLFPIVLAPLFLGRIKIRDAVFAIALVVAVYLPFSQGGTVPLGAVPNVIAYIRFNGPLFRAIADAVSPHAAAGIAVVIGLVAAVWARSRCDPSDPAGWAWPMAVALVCSPVVYPWYLLCFTPFLFASSTLPLIAWTFSVLPVYLVWHLSRHGERWIVPAQVMAAEYGAVVLAAVIVAAVSLRARNVAERRRSTTDELLG